MENKSSLHKKKDGRVFQMFSGLSEEPMRFQNAKHNYTRSDMDLLPVGGSIGFMPIYGNKNPVPSLLIRIK